MLKIQWVTTLSLTIRVNFHSFSSKLLLPTKSARSRKIFQKNSNL